MAKKDRKKILQDKRRTERERDRENRVKIMLTNQ
jgi:hypothetical protein